MHSLKDMPMEVPEDLPLLAFPKRERPEDVLVLPEGESEMDVKSVWEARVPEGTSR